ncbi:MAG: NAD(P)-dependent oxidoreductase, partial [Sphingomicrobium sp.]
LSTPKPLLRLAAAIDGLVRGGGAKLTPDRVAYFCHPDWVVSPALPAPEPWQPRIDTVEGLADTAEWYRAQGWL